jgi:hypothetical protein
MYVTGWVRGIAPPNKEEQEMKSKIGVTGVSLASMALILLGSGVAWAQAEETPLEIRLARCEILEPAEREWVDEDGVRHVRDRMFSCWFDRDMTGKITGWLSGEDDVARGYVFERGYYTFTGSILGTPATGVGRYTDECNRVEAGVWSCVDEEVVHLDGGGLVRMFTSWEGSRRHPLLSGTLLDTPGGESRQGPRPRR